MKYLTSLESSRTNSASVVSSYVKKGLTLFSGTVLAASSLMIIPVHVASAAAPRQAVSTPVATQPTQPTTTPAVRGTTHAAVTSTSSSKLSFAQAPQALQSAIRNVNATHHIHLTPHFAGQPVSFESHRNHVRGVPVRCAAPLLDA